MKDRRIFQIFSTQGQSEFLVVSAVRWDKFSKVIEAATQGRV